MGTLQTFVSLTFRRKHRHWCISTNATLDCNKMEGKGVE